MSDPREEEREQPVYDDNPLDAMPPLGELPTLRDDEDRAHFIEAADGKYYRADDGCKPPPN